MTLFSADEVSPLVGGPVCLVVGALMITGAIRNWKFMMTDRRRRFLSGSRSRVDRTHRRHRISERLGHSAHILSELICAAVFVPAQAQGT